MTQQADPWLGAVLGGRYRILRALGAGGAGAVYEAEQEGLGRKVAVKLMRSELAADLEHLERFRREARAAAQLGHPHIVQLFDFAEARGSEPAYLVLELVNGRSLLQLLRTEAPIDPHRAVKLAGQILAALSAAHAAGIVHRDIKPGNVVVQDVPGVGEVAKVLDFGIARVQESEAYQRLTRTGVIIGTPRYMSPEQASGSPVDGRTDLWAMGVVLYAALTARFPFEGSPTEVVIAIMTAPVPPMNRAEVPPALEAAVRRALQKAPGDRYASAEAMADALRASLAPAPMEHATSHTAAQPTAPAWTAPAGAQTVMHGGPPPDATRAALSSPTPTREAAPWIPRAPTSVAAPYPATPYAAAPIAVAAPPPSGLSQIPVWARWLTALVLLGGLGALSLFLMVLFAWAPSTRSPIASSPVLGGVPSLGVADPGGAPTHGTSGEFFEDAVQRAAAHDPSARLAVISGLGVATSTGSLEVGEGRLWSFVFAGGDGHPFQIAYAAGVMPYPMIADVAIAGAPLPNDLPDSATVLAMAVATCPRLLDADQVTMSVLGMAGQEPTVSVAVAHGATWTGRLVPGGVTQTATYLCQ